MDNPDNLQARNEAEADATIFISGLQAQIDTRFTSAPKLDGFFWFVQGWMVRNNKQPEETTVELVPNNYDCMLTCSKCRDGVPYYLLEEFDDINFCPSCGRRINKEKHGKKP